MSRIAVITGGSRGIGRAITYRFAKEGYIVIIGYRSNEQAAKETVQKAYELGAQKAYSLKVDLADPKSIEEFSNKISEMVDYVNVLVNNAGILQKNGIEETSLDEWNKTIQVNLTGVYLVTKHLLPLLKKARWSSIINISSIAGVTGNVVAGIAYSASKAGVIGLTKRLATELAKYGIRVNAVAPSFVETDMVREYLDTPEKREAIRKLHPLGIILKPEDIAETVYFLANPETARGITGQVLEINAGRHT